MKTYAVYLLPHGSLATWPLASDTLFGAVCWGMRWLGLMNDEELTHWLEEQRLKPRFAFSHAFPAWLQEPKKIRFYPRPANYFPSHEDFDSLALSWQSAQKHEQITLKAAKAVVVSITKQLKKISYLSESVLKKIITEGLHPRDILSSILFASRKFSIKGQVLCTEEEGQQLPNALFSTEAVQHNQIDRMAGATVEGMLFYRDETFFSKGAGLWAVLVAEEEDFKRFIQPALNYLADTGFGADRTVGKGQFEIFCEEFQLSFQASQPTA